MTDFQTMPQKIAASIIQMMKERKINNGDKLCEESYTKLFQVSQTVIRESFFILESKGLVTRIPRRGVFLKLPNRQEIGNLFETRELIETFVNKKAAESFSEENIGELEKIMRASEEQLEARNYGQYFRYGGAFHSIVYDLTGFNRLGKLYNNIQDLFDVYYVNQPENIDYYQENMIEVKDHRLIFEAIKNKKVDDIEKLTLIHIKHVRERLERKIPGSLN